jgi:hypothetical protein
MQGKLLIAVLVLGITGPAQARSSHHYSHHSRGGHVDGFRTGHCKTSRCFSRHLGGRYVYPLTSPKYGNRANRRHY